MTAPYDVSAVEHLGGHRLRLTFVDGTVREVDFGPTLSGSVDPVYEPLRDVAFFAQAAVDPETHTVVWPNGADVAPDALHEGTIGPASTT